MLPNTTSNRMVKQKKESVCPAEKSLNHTGFNIEDAMCVAGVTGLRQ